MAKSFTQKIISWYKNHMRELPWRLTEDPYKIWLSEIILQQTRVAQGLPYYEKFIAKYPTVHDLAVAPQDEVLRMWQGLGYYSRARNLHSCAQSVVEDYDGHFPETYEELQKLKGIGKYTAAAIASFAFKKKVPVVDGNVFRVLSRFLVIDKDIADPKNFKLFFEASKELISEDQPDLYNQALMELGATLCSVSKPACLLCPVAEECQARIEGKQTELPIKLKKVKVRKRYFYYLLIEQNEKLLMGKRGPNDIWQGLFDFPLIESKNVLSTTELEKELSSIFPKQKHFKYELSNSVKHILTHQRIEAFFISIDMKKAQIKINGYSWYDEGEVEELPKPRLVDKYLKENFY
jgi:A/G-specific adenine glycosylase